MAYNSIDDIKTILSQYKESIEDNITDIIEEVANEGKKQLRNTKNTYKVRTGAYNKSWNVHKENADRFVGRTIYNKKHYRLSHLLEDGHMTRNGRTRTRAFKHIAPVEQYCVDRYVNQVEEIIKKGGK